MTLGLVFDAALALTVLAIALWMILVRATFSAAVGFVGYGMLVALVWVRLGAVDVALTEAAIGGGMMGVMMLIAAKRMRGLGSTLAEASGKTERALAAALCAAVSIILGAVVLSLPDPPPTLAAAAAENLSAFGLGNPVTAVLLGYRALDTLLETIVMLLALVGVWSLTPDPWWGGLPGRGSGSARDEALVLLGRMLPPLGIVVGVHIVWAGADAPGGKFQGATILAAMWILVMAAGLARPPRVGRPGLRILLAAGPALFIAVGLAGFPLAGSFLAFPEPYAKLLIVGLEMVLMLSLAATLALLVVGPPARRMPS